MSIVVYYGYVIHPVQGYTRELLQIGCFLPAPYDVVRLLSLPDPAMDIDVFDETFVIGFEPNAADLHALMNLSHTLEQIVFHSPLLNGYNVEKLPRFVAGYLRPDDSDSEAEDDSEEDYLPTDNSETDTDDSDTDDSDTDDSDTDDSDAEDT